MLLLAIDTSGRNGSIALAEGGAADQFRSLEVIPLTAGEYSSQLIPQAGNLLERAHLAKGALSAFAVVSGPGSFTGLRVGLSTAKALAEITAAPLAAVSALEAVAWSSGQTGLVIAALDAGRGQVFMGEYEVRGDRAAPRREWLATLEELIRASSEQHSEGPPITADGILAMTLESHGLAVRAIPAPQADVIACLGFHKILRGETVSPETLDANYIRRSDAELFSLPISP